MLFLPVEFFKSNHVKTGPFNEEAVFLSSTTSGSSPSKHFVRQLSLYKQSYLAGFQYFYGPPTDYCFLALLPSYLERQGSSLVSMSEGLIKLSNHPLGGFYLDDFEKLSATLDALHSNKQKTILLGVSFALLDFADRFPINFPDLIVMETGGMKGRKKEMIREELHASVKIGI